MRYRPACASRGKPPRQRRASPRWGGVARSTPRGPPSRRSARAVRRRRGCRRAAPPTAGPARPAARRSSWLERGQVLAQLRDGGVEGMRLNPGHGPHAPRGDARAEQEEEGDRDGDRQALAVVYAQNDRHGAEREADGGEKERREPGDDERREARQLLAQLGAEELEARASEVEEARQDVARRLEKSGAHLRLSRTPARSPIAAAMPTAAHGLARTWLSSSAPAPLRCSRAMRSDSSARARTSCTRGPASPAVARSSSSASAITARRSFMKLSAASMRFPGNGRIRPYAHGSATAIGPRA